MDKIDLKNYKALVVEVQQLKDQLHILEGSLYSPRGQLFTSTPRVPSGTRSTMDGAVEMHMDLERLYREKLAEKEAQQLAVERAIQALPDPAERLIMRERYIAGRGWYAVVKKAAMLGLSERTVYRLHGLALLKLKEV